MTPFEYDTVFISIILGLGSTQILTGVADIISPMGQDEIVLAKHDVDFFNFYYAHPRMVVHLRF